MFRKWSGLKVNNSKTQFIVFNIKCSEPLLVNTRELKWCTSFVKTLELMDVNYDKGLENIKKVTNNWMFKNLTFF